jgi:predicted GIY-YIG superfamily endonuclease
MSVYLLHFDKKIGRIQHYIGWSNDAETRIQHHREGKGSRLTKALFNKGIDFKVAYIWSNGDRVLERDLKDHHRACDLCPICQNLSTQLY